MTAFELSNVLVLPFWALMILAPAWSLTRRVIGSPWIVAPFAVIYLVAITPGLSFILPEVVNPQQARIASLLGTPTGATVAWVHFITLDLFAGRWIYCDSRRRQYSPLWVSPVLLLTLLLCPVGLLVYLCARTAIGGADVADGRH